MKRRHFLFGLGSSALLPLPLTPARAASPSTAARAGAAISAATSGAAGASHPAVGLVSQGVAALASGQLEADQFVPAKMPLQAARVVLPRPDTETSPRAYHRNAQRDVPYELPIVVQGGSWPFVFELIDAPAGATLGRLHGDEGYGILRWVPQAEGAFAFTVRVRDQDGASVEFSWSGTVASGWMRFVDAVHGSDEDGDGSITAPWRSLAHAVPQVNDGGALCLRAGAYAAAPQALNLAVSGGSGPGRIGSLVGWPGEVAVIDCSTQTGPHFAWYNSSDTYVAGLAFEGGPDGQANPRYFVSLSVNHRCYQYRLQFDAPVPGTTSGGGDDNNSCLFLGAGGAVREYVAQVACRFRRLHRTNNGFSAIDTYQTRYLVVADNVFETPASPDTARHAIWIKGWEQEDVSVRGNRWNEAWGGSLIEVSMSSSAGAFSARRIELCYNTLVARTQADAIHLGSAPSGPARGPIWVYRNTVVGKVVIARRDWPLQISFEHDIVVHDVEVAGGNSAGKVLLSDPNSPAGVYLDPDQRANLDLTLAGIECHARSTDAVLDGQQRLQGAWRSQFLGRRGAEIAVPGAVFADGFEAV